MFDGRRASYEDLSSAKKGQGPRLIPPAQAADLDVDIAWLVPAFFDYPAEYLGTGESGGAQCHKLGVTLPLGARVVYFLDTATNLVLYNRPQGSLPTVMLLHAAMNTAVRFLPLPLAGLVLILLAAVSLVVFDRMWRRLPRDRGCQRTPAERK